MLGRESGNCDVCVLVDDARLDFMGIQLPAIRIRALVSLWVGPCLDVNVIGLQDVVRSSKSIPRDRILEWGAPA